MHPGCSAHIAGFTSPGRPVYLAPGQHHGHQGGGDRIDNWKFYVIYNLFRSAAIVQGVYKRGLDGNASSVSALEYGDECRNRADRAWELVVELEKAGAC